MPALFWADGETPILVSVRRKSSRALPSEANPIKIGLKIDINELVDGQKWRDLTKVSLENGADSGVVQEGLAWNLHRLASSSYGYQAALASWVQLRINGQLTGVFVNAEQRDKQILRNRGVWTDDETWIFDQDDIGVPEIEEGDGFSPTYDTLCYVPFRVGGKKSSGTCPTPTDAELANQLPLLINMPGMLTQGAVDAYTDNSRCFTIARQEFSVLLIRTTQERTLDESIFRGTWTRSSAQPRATFTLPARVVKCRRRHIRR